MKCGGRNNINKMCQTSKNRISGKTRPDDNKYGGPPLSWVNKVGHAIENLETEICAAA